jgi:hypothetical protein
MSQVEAAGRSQAMQGRPRRPASATRLASQVPLALAHGLATVAIVAGWWLREEHFLIPGEGLGYALGILGLSAMTVMLLYSVRKRFRSLQRLGKLSTWFQAHMILGLAGPVAILYHCNFRLGSVNSNLALFCTLAVAASGVVGRVVYVRIHHQLSGRRATLAELREQIATRRIDLPRPQDAEALARLLRDFEAQVLFEDRGLGAELLGQLLLGVRSRRTARAARRHLQGSARGARTALESYLRAVRRVAAFSLYERVFALWHAIHLPLCFLLFATAAVHVLAVNLY